MLYFSNGLSQYTQRCNDATGLMTTKSWFSSQQQKILLFFKTCSLVMGPT
jgi:hypothetical protein